MNNFYNDYYRYYNNPYISTPSNRDNSPEKNNVNDDNYNSNKEKSSRYSSFGPIHFKNPLFSDIESPVFEIFGIKLYLDDIIILGLLFFLYKEEVQDEMLFIILILLLIS